MSVKRTDGQFVLEVGGGHVPPLSNSQIIWDAMNRLMPACPDPIISISVKSLWTQTADRSFDRRGRLGGVTPPEETAEEALFGSTHTP